MKSFALTLTCALSMALFAGVFVSAEEKKADVPPLLKHEMKSLTGKKVDLAKYKGKVLLKETKGSPVKCQALRPSHRLHQA